MERLLARLDVLADEVHAVGRKLRAVEEGQQDVLSEVRRVQGRLLTEQRTTRQKDPVDRALEAEAARWKAVAEELAGGEVLAVMPGRPPPPATPVSVPAVSDAFKPGHRAAPAVKP